MKKRITAASFLVLLMTFGLNAQNSLLPPFPKVPEKKPLNSVEMGDWKSFPEIKLDVPITPGPFEPTWESIEKNYPGEPAWLREAKFGIWVHFGPQSAGAGDFLSARKPEGVLLPNPVHRAGIDRDRGVQVRIAPVDPRRILSSRVGRELRPGDARSVFRRGSVRAARVSCRGTAGCDATRDEDD
jgi:alpha-L-fucosidase